MGNNLTIQQQQVLFQTVINKFLLKNKTFKGTMQTSISVVIIIASLLTLISIWIPIVFGSYVLIIGLRGLRRGYKTNLTKLESEVIIKIGS